MDAHSLFSKLQDFDKWYCLPSVTFEQVKDVVEKSLREKPEARHAGGTLVVMGALAFAWPCSTE